MAWRDISAYTRPRYIESSKSQTIYAGALLTPSLTRDYNVLSWSNIDENNSFYELQVCRYPSLLTNENYQGSIAIQDTSPNPTITFPANPQLYDSYVINKSTNGQEVVYNNDVYYFATEVVIWDGTAWVKLWELYQEYADDNYNGIIAPQQSLSLRFDLPDGWYQFRIRSSAYIQDPNDFEIRRFYSQWSNITEAFEVKTLATPYMNDIDGTSQYYITHTDEDAAFFRISISRDSNVARYTDYLPNEVPTVTNPIQLDYNEAGSYTIIVAAMSSQEFYFHQSHTNELVDRKVYSVIKLNTPVVDDNQFQEDPHPTIVWGQIDNATGYNVYLNDNPVYYDLSALTYSFANITEPSDNYRAYIKATRSGQYDNEYLDTTHNIIVRTSPKYNNPKYLDSDMSSLKVGDDIFPETPTVFGILPTPTVRMNDIPGRDNELIITNAEDLQGASEFAIYDNGVVINTINSSNNVYKVESYEPRIFSLQVQAKSDSSHMGDSLLSNVLNYEVLRLQTPVITLSSNDGNFATINWNSINNASQYKIYINGSNRYTTSNTEFRVELNTGKNNIYVVATSPYYRFLDSLNSNIINANKEATDQFLITIENKDYEIQLPFSFRETLDETMDSAAVSTIAIDDKLPFEAYTPVIIKGNYINSEPVVDENGKIIDVNISYTPIQSFPKYMLISKDDVEEIQLGSESKYVHHLNLIERTKLLECELLPDYSISQPLEYVLAKNNISVGTAYKDQNNMSIWSDSQVLAQSNFVWIVTYFSGRFSYLTGLNNSNVSGSLPNLMYNGQTYSLPYESATSFYLVNLRCWSGDMADFWQAASAVTGLNYVTQLFSLANPALQAFKVGWYEALNSLTDLGIKLRKTYKYRTHSDSYDPDPNHEEKVIGIYYDGLQHEWTPNLDISSEGYIDIILEVDMSDADFEVVKSRMIQETTGRVSFHTIDHKPEFMYSGNLTDYTRTYIPNGGDNWAWNGEDWLWCPGDSTMSQQNADGVSDYYEKSKKYRIVWSGIAISNMNNFNERDIIKEKSKSIYYALDKTLNILNPIVNKSDRKYELDPKLQYLDSKITLPSGEEYNIYPCPEFQFTGQKSLYEALHEIGRTFYGIPRLGCYDDDMIWHENMITFDKLDEETQQSLEEIIDMNTLEDTASTIDNHSTGYVSNLSNVITNDYYMSYPSGDLWTTARTKSDSEPLCTHDNMALVVDLPIYRIVDVLITNYRNDLPDKVLSIRNYVNESQIYASLNNNYEGKGLSLMYKQNSNIIEGLGQIPEASSFYAAIGFQNDYYVIQNILHYADGLGLPGMFGSTMKDPSEFRYKILYVPYINGKVYTEQSNIAGLKYNNYKALNQEVNVISDNAFGQSAQTQVERLGNNNIKKVYRYATVDSRLPKLGSVRKFDGYNYYADIVDYSYGNNFVDIQVEFTKNFNKINERIGIDAQYRLFRITTSGYVNRSINFNNYCYISRDIYSPNGTVRDVLVNNIKNSFNDGTKSSPITKPDTLYIKNYKSLNEQLQYNDYTTGNLVDVPCAVLPVSYNRYGTNVCFSTTFKDNYSVGVAATDVYYPPAAGLFDWEAKAQYINKDVRYVDTNGESEYIDLTLFRMNSSDSDVRALGLNPRRYPMANKIDVPSNLPNTVLSEKVLLEKDSREQLSFAYQLHFQTYDKNIRIHPGITKRLYVTDQSYSSQESQYSEVRPPVYILYKGDLNRRHTVNDRVQYRILSAPTFTAETSNGQYIHVGTVSFTTDTNYDGYALVWPDSGELIYSYKTEIVADENSQQIPDIYMNFSSDKISYQTR